MNKKYWQEVFDKLDKMPKEEWEEFCHRIDNERTDLFGIATDEEIIELLKSKEVNGQIKEGFSIFRKESK